MRHPNVLEQVRDDKNDPEALDRNLMFSGHNTYRFATDSFSPNAFIPGVKQLVERMLNGR